MRAAPTLPPPRPQTETVLRSLARAYGLMRRVAGPHFARFGVSVSQWTVLRALQRAHEEGLVALRQNELGARLLVQPPSVTGVVDRLRRMGLVTSAVSRSDQRAKEIRLTPLGRRRVAEIVAAQPARQRLLLAGLAPRERRELHRLLDRLGDHLETIVDPGAFAP
jgi:DNA-binding MarR family transcriptional regulator